MRSVGMITMGNRTRVARMVAECFNYYLYLVLKTATVKLFGKLPKILGRIATFYFYHGFFFRTSLRICSCDDLLPAKRKSRKEESFRK